MLLNIKNKIETKIDQNDSADKVQLTTIICYNFWKLQF